MFEPLSSVERQQMLIRALLEPEYERAYLASPRAKATITQFAQMVPLMLRGLMEEAARDHVADMERLAEAMDAPPPTFILGDLTKEPSSPWRDRYSELLGDRISTEASCPTCGWHTEDVLREGHICPGPRAEEETPEQVRARELMEPHLARLRSEHRRLDLDGRNRFIILVPADWPAEVEGTLFGKKIRRGAVSRPVFSTP